MTVWLFASCRNNESRSIQLAKDYLHISNHISLVVPVIVEISNDPFYLKELLANQADTSLSCATFRYVSGDTSTMLGPIEFEIDYFQGCLDNDGIAKAGVLVCNLQGSFSSLNSECLVAFDGFKIANDFFWGGFDILNKDTNKWKIITKDYAIQSNKKLTSFEDTLLFCKISGDSSNNFDHEFLISSKGLLNSAVSGYSIDLVKKMSCNWFSQGIIELNIEDETKQIINLGMGDCDNEAILQIGVDEFVIEMN